MPARVEKSGDIWPRLWLPPHLGYSNHSSHMGLVFLHLVDLGGGKAKDIHGQMPFCFDVSRG